MQVTLTFLLPTLSSSPNIIIRQYLPNNLVCVFRTLCRGTQTPVTAVSLSTPYHNRCRRYTVALLLDEMDTRSKEIKATIPLQTQTTTLASPHSCSLGTWLGYHCKSLYSPSRTRHNLCASQNVALPPGPILNTHVARSRSFRTEDISPCHWPNGQSMLCRTASHPHFNATIPWCSECIRSDMCSQFIYRCAAFDSYLGRTTKCFITRWNDNDDDGQAYYDNNDDITTGGVFV